MAKLSKKRRFIHPKRTVFGRIRAYFFAGILVTAPLGISLWITWGIIKFFDAQVVKLIPPQYNPETYLPITLPGLGLVLTIIVLTLVGWLAAGLMGRWLVRIPLWPARFVLAAGTGLLIIQLIIDFCYDINRAIAGGERTTTEDVLNREIADAAKFIDKDGD